MRRVAIEDGNELCIYGRLPREAEAQLTHVFRGLPRFSFYQIQGESGAVYSAAAYNTTPTKAGAICTYDNRLRPARTLLRQLERTATRQTECTRIGNLPDVTLWRSLAEQAAGDPGKCMVVNARTLRETLEGERGETEGEDDPLEVFGPKEFCLGIGEAVELERSARLVVDPAVLPPKYYAALAALTTKYIAYYSDRRTKPLADLGTPLAAEEIRIELEQMRTRCEVLRAKLLDDIPPPITAESTPEHVRVYEDWQRQMHRCAGKIRHAALALTTDPNVISDVDHRHRAFLDELRADPQAYGFRDAAQLEDSLKLSINELSSSVSHSQKGYFMLDGHGGRVNQLCGKTPVPVTFVCAAGIDFCTDTSTRVEGGKYFEEDPGWAHTDSMVSKFTTWRENGEERLFRRVKSLYRCIFHAAELQRASHPCVLPIGLGVFLENVPTACKDTVMRCYFRAQYELLAERTWGFTAYIMNAGAPACARFAHDFFHKENVADKIKVPIVVHTRDLKFVCTALAEARLASAYLNPSDAIAVLLGAIGYYWEVGQGTSYVGEEDFAATSTAVLGRSNISDVWQDVSRIIAIGSDDTHATPCAPASADEARRMQEYEELQSKKLERFTGASGVPAARLWP